MRRKSFTLKLKEISALMQRRHGGNLQLDAVAAVYDRRFNCRTFQFPSVRFLGCARNDYMKVHTHNVRSKLRY